MKAWLRSCDVRTGGVRTHKRHPAYLPASLAAAAAALTASLSARRNCRCGGRDRGATRTSLLLVAAARPAGFTGRVAPPSAAGDGRPAVRFVGVEVLDRRRGRVVAVRVVGAVEVERQGRVVLRVGFLVVGPLLVLGCLGPDEVVGQRRLREPVVRVGVLDESLIKWGERVSSSLSKKN